MTGFVAHAHTRYAHRLLRPPSRSIVATLVLLACVSRSTAQSLEVAPPDTGPIAFTGFEGGPFFAQHAFTWTLSNSDLQELDFAVSANQPWVTVSPSSGALPDSFLNRSVEVTASLTADADRLSSGVYSATLSFLNLTGGPGTVVRTIELHVAPASFSVSPSFVNATGMVPGSNPPAVVVHLESAGQVDLNYSLSWPSKPWLIVNRTSGTVPAGREAEFTIEFNTFGLAAGTYSTSLAITNTTNGAGTRDLPITLVLQPATAGAITLSPDEDVEAGGREGAISGAAKTFLLSNTGQQQLEWIAESDEPFVTLTPAAGLLSANDGAAGGPDGQFVDIRVNAGANELDAGSHTATVTFSEVIVNPLTGAVTEVPFATRLVRVVADPALTVALPLGGGRVAVSPPGRNVAGGSSQTILYEFGDVVTLTASVDDGYEFDGWAGDFEIEEPLQNPLVVTMDDSKSVSAIVTPVLRTLTLSTSGEGTGTIAAAPAPVFSQNALVAKYSNGTTVRLTATPDDGSLFMGWDGNVAAGAAGENPTEILMDRDRTITARFQLGILLTLQVSGDGEVEITPDLDIYEPGATVNLVAIPAEGAEFDGWSGDATGQSTSLTITLDEDTLVVANFVEAGSGGGNNNMAKLQVEVAGDGVVTPPGGNYAIGAEVTLIATPGLGSSFVRWEQDASGSSLATVITMTSDRTVRALFQPAEDPEPRPSPGAGATCGALGLAGAPLLFGLGVMLIAPRGRRGLRFRLGSAESVS